MPGAIRQWLRHRRAELHVGASGVSVPEEKGHVGADTEAAGGCGGAALCGGATAGLGAGVEEGNGDGSKLPVLWAQGATYTAGAHPLPVWAESGVFLAGGDVPRCMLVARKGVIDGVRGRVAVVEGHSADLNVVCLKAILNQAAKSDGRLFLGTGGPVAADRRGHSLEALNTGAANGPEPWRRRAKDRRARSW
eukprot:gene9969-biopygen7074